MKNLWMLALGWMLLLEGVMPLLWPRQWRETMQRIGALADGQIRFVGLVVLLCGAALLALARFFS